MFQISVVPQVGIQYAVSIITAALVCCEVELLHCIHSCIFWPNSQAYEFIKRSLAEGAMSSKDIAAIEEQERIGEAGSV